MIAHYAGIASALAITGTAIGGMTALIALDLLGEETFFKFWEKKPTPVETVSNLPALTGAKDITFFTTVPAPGRAFVISTGTSFATPADLALNKPSARWCYTMIGTGSGFERRVPLANQMGSSDPIFHDLSAYPSSELQALGIGADELEALAKTACALKAISKTGTTSSPAKARIWLALEGGPT